MFGGLGQRGAVAGVEVRTVFQHHHGGLHCIERSAITAQDAPAGAQCLDDVAAAFFPVRFALQAALECPAAAVQAQRDTGHAFIAPA